MTPTGGYRVWPHTRVGLACYSLMSGRSSAWGDQHGSIDRAEEVVLLSQWRGAERACAAFVRTERRRRKAALTVFANPNPRWRRGSPTCVAFHNAPPAYIRVLQAWTDPS